MGKYKRPAKRRAEAARREATRPTVRAKVGAITYTGVVFERDDAVRVFEYRTSTGFTRQARKFTLV